jgi:hypothetical protein
LVGTVSNVHIDLFDAARKEDAEKKEAQIETPRKIVLNFMFEQGWGREKASLCREWRTWRIKEVPTDWFAEIQFLYRYIFTEKPLKSDVVRPDHKSLAEFIRSRTKIKKYQHLDPEKLVVWTKRL